MTRRLMVTLAGAATAFLALVPNAGATAVDPVPSGQRVLGQSVVEPVYDAADAGVIGFISTPARAPLNSNERARAPLYVPVYPAGSHVGQLLCPHEPVDTCPGHGDGIAGLARSLEPDVYAAGVLGHDHVAQLHGPDARVSLVPTAVLFTSRAAAEQHLLTEAAIDSAIARGDAIAVPLDAAALHGAQVAAKVWELATPLQ